MRPSKSFCIVDVALVAALRARENSETGRNFLFFLIYFNHGLHLFSKAYAGLWVVEELRAKNGTGEAQQHVS